jgi:hypothetical protein
MPSPLRPGAAVVALLAVVVLVAACSRSSTTVSDSRFEAYAGATLDQAATDAANALAASVGQANKVSRIYMTPADYDTVAAFYLARGTAMEVPPLPEASRRLPDGSEIRRQVVILDGAPSLVESDLWVVVQRPFVGNERVEGGKPVLEDVRDVTTIVVVERH